VIPPTWTPVAVVGLLYMTSMIGKRGSHPAARAYPEHNQAEGESRREAIRCLKRQRARAVYTTLKADSVLT
jgi:hypothetical protein